MGERLDGDSFRRIAKQVIQLKKQGDDVVLVSSGAITAGMMQTGISHRPKGNMAALQRFASLGWHAVLGKWQRALSWSVGGVLLTQHSLNLQGECAEFQAVTHELLRAGDIPIINENDVISHAEIAFGDNDTLAATVAVRLADGYDATHLVILSDVRGVYRDKTDPSTVIGIIKTLDEYAHFAGDSTSEHGTGGMKAKFAAASVAQNGGVVMHIAYGRTERAVERAMRGQIGTTFSL